MTTPTPQTRIAALAAKFYASGPRISTGPHKRRGVGYNFAPDRLARALVEFFGAGFRATYIGDSDRRTIVHRDRLDPTKARRRSREYLASLVRQAVLLMPTPTEDAPHALRCAVRDLHEHATQERSYYLTQVVDALVDELERLPSFDPMPEIVGPAKSAEPRRRPVDPEKAEQRRAQRREGMRAVREEIRANELDDAPDAVEWALGWLAQAEPGAYPASVVYTAYTDDADSPLGKQKFYRYADHPQVLGPRRRRVSGPAYVVTQEAPQMTKEERRQLAELVVRQLANNLKDDLRAGLREMYEAEAAQGSTEVTAGNLVPFRVVGRKAA